MSDTARTEIELEDDALLPANDDTVTPFAELSRLMVIGIGADEGNKLVWTAQTAPNGPWDTKWTPVNDGSYDLLGTGTTTDGRVAMVVQTHDDKSVQYIAEKENNDGETKNWAAPVDLGMPDGLAGFVELTMTRDASGRIEIFGVDDSGGNVWWIYQNPPKIVDTTEQITPPGTEDPVTVQVQVAEPPDQPWSDWIPLPGETVARITTANNADGRIMLIATGQDPEARALYVNNQTVETALAPDQWTGWKRIDNAHSGTAGSKPTAVLDRQGAVNIFMIGDLAEVVQIRQQPPGSDSWSAWARPGMTDSVLLNVTAAFDGDGDISLMAVGEHAQLFYNQQADSLTQKWSGWQQIGKVDDFGEIMMDYNADGRLTYFQGLSKTNGLAYVSQFVTDATSWDAGFVQFAASDISTYGVARDLTPLEAG
ncbi:MAG: hypothetical protein AAGE05_10435 [Pseudomonadota bacterium]